MQNQKPPRPTGVTIIAILALLVGAVGLIAGFAIVAFSAILATIGFGIGGLFAGIGLIIAGIVFIFSFIWLLTGWGFLNGKGWAWTLGLIFSILSILVAIAGAATGSTSGIVGVFIWALMVYYLLTGRVKTFFGKGPAIPPTYANTPSTGIPNISPASIMGPSIAGSSIGSIGTPRYGSTPNTNRFCTNCGATVGPGTARCSNCGTNL